MNADNNSLVTFSSSGSSSSSSSGSSSSDDDDDDDDTMIAEFFGPEPPPPIDHRTFTCSPRRRYNHAHAWTAIQSDYLGLIPLFYGENLMQCLYFKASF